MMTAHDTPKRRGSAMRWASAVAGSFARRNFDQSSQTIMSTARVKANRVRSRVCPARGGPDGDPDPRRGLFVWRSLRLAHAATNVVDHLANLQTSVRTWSRE